MGVTMHFYKDSSVDLIDNQEYPSRFYKLSVNADYRIEMSYSLRHDFYHIYKSVIGQDFPTLEEGYATEEEAKACIISQKDMFDNIKRVIEETDGIQNTGIDDLDVEYMRDLFRAIVLRLAEGYSVIVDYA